MACKKTQAYTEEFSREAVKRAEKEGVTTASVARELGVAKVKSFGVDGRVARFFLRRLIRRNHH